ncbi:hypothetical protein THRCLA_08976 [Thraustotheca clavata]|uniref:PSP1 C-terminal domain-containing protein n=1 Tax=Thraustotheca clavata TaxID=74557 RepID=A0A1V9Z0G9_9STRA|nr:hypothetical protein THRCLA_08976 [Thraustotheca clavata]
MLARWTFGRSEDEKEWHSQDNQALEALSYSFTRPRRESKLKTWKIGQVLDNQSNHDELLEWNSMSALESPKNEREKSLNDPTPPLNVHAPSFIGRKIEKQEIIKVESVYLPFVSSYLQPPLPPTNYYIDDNNAFQTSNEKESVMFDTRCQTLWYYEVEFKRYRRNIFLGQPYFAIGDFVKVEADRGFDVGRIVRYGETLERVRSSLNHVYGDSMYLDKRFCMPLKRILRLVSSAELHQLNRKFEEEAIVLEVCREKVRQRSLPMQVIDAEFQFDRHKLTFFFEADRRIDFRELVRDLFGLYKTRIWLQQVSQ